MAHKILFETKAKKEFLDLPVKIQERISPAVEALKEAPRPVNCVKLAGANGFRVRAGDYRILYTVNDKEKTVVIYRIGHRREVYR